MRNVIATYDGSRTTAPWTFPTPYQAFFLQKVSGGIPQFMVLGEDYDILDEDISVRAPLPLFSSVEVVEDLLSLSDLTAISDAINERPLAKLDSGRVELQASGSNYAGSLRFSPRKLEGTVNRVPLGQCIRVSSSDPKRFNQLAVVDSQSSDMTARLTLRSWDTRLYAGLSDITGFRSSISSVQPTKTVSVTNTHTLPLSIGLGAQEQERDASFGVGVSSLISLSNKIVPYVFLKTDKEYDVIRDGQTLRTDILIPGDEVDETYVQGISLAVSKSMKVSMWILPLGTPWDGSDGVLSIGGYPIPAGAVWSIERTLLEIQIPSLYRSQIVVFFVSSSLGNDVGFRDMTEIYSSRSIAVTSEGSGWYQFTQGATSKNPLIVTANLTVDYA